MTKPPSQPIQDQPLFRTTPLAREMPACTVPFAPGYPRDLLPANSDMWTPEQGAEVGTEESIAVPADLDVSTLTTIRIDDTNGAWWSQGGFRLPTADLRSIRQAVRNYERYLDDQSGQQILVRPVVLSPATDLPLHLRGVLPRPLPSDPKPDQVFGIIDECLSSQLTGTGNEAKQVATLLFGLPDDDRDWQRFFPETLRYDNQLERPLREVVALEGSDAGGTFRQPRYYVRYQQVFDAQYPVLGGQVSSRIAPDERDFLCSSTYLPVPDDALKYADGREIIDDVRAKELAAQAVGHVLLLDAAEHIDGQDDLAQNNADVPLPNEIIPDEEKGWKIRIYNHSGSPLCLVPYRTDDSDYHLAYEVRLTAPDFGGTWSVLVDAFTEEILDLPRLLTHFAFVFESSEHARQGAPFLPITLPGNPAHNFMDVEKAGSNPVVSFSTEEKNGPDFEAVHVAFHGLRTFDALITRAGVRCEDLVHAEKRLKAVVNKLPDSSGRLVIGFDSNERVITFPFDDGNGIGSHGAKIHQPARDPEVIYHEIIHGLTWMLNSDPFENQVGIAPFSRALSEGCATYLARSIAQHHTGDAQSRWAIAAYREDDWGDRWALARDPRAATNAGDVLPIANVFPGVVTVNDSSNLAIYDAGMIWARMLWDLRLIMPPEDVDKLAVRSFMAARGWVTSFEGIAEAVLEELQTESQLQGMVDQLLRARGIAARRGIRTVFIHDNTVLAGGDDMAMSSNDGINWHALPLANPAPGVVEGVVDLAASANALYVLTEDGLLQRPSGASEWELISDLTLPHQESSRSLGRPLSLVVTDADDLYLGVGGGVYQANAAGGNVQWSPAPESTPSPLTGLPLGMTLIHPTAAETALCVAGFNAVWIRSLPMDPAKPWTRIDVGNANEALVICVTSHLGQTFVGTCYQGIWQIQRNGASSFSTVQIAAPSDLGGGAVLCLAVDPQPSPKLFAGTTNGLFIGEHNQANGQWQWRAVVEFPNDAFPGTLAVLFGEVFIGTAYHGLLKLDSTEHVSTVSFGQMVNQQLLRAIDLGTSQSFTGSGIPGGNIHAFRVSSPGRIQVTVTPLNNGQAPRATVRRLAPNLPAVQLTGNSIQESSVPLDQGYYFLTVDSSTAYDANVSLVSL